MSYIYIYILYKHYTMSTHIYVYIYNINRTNKYTYSLSLYIYYHTTPIHPPPTLTRAGRFFSQPVVRDPPHAYMSLFVYIYRRYIPSSAMASYSSVNHQTDQRHPT